MVQLDGGEIYQEGKGAPWATKNIVFFTILHKQIYRNLKIIYNVI